MRDRPSYEIRQEVVEVIREIGAEMALSVVAECATAMTLWSVTRHLSRRLEVPIQFVSSKHAKKDCLAALTILGERHGFAVEVVDDEWVLHPE